MGYSVAIYKIGDCDVVIINTKDSTIVEHIKVKKETESISYDDRYNVTRKGEVYKVKKVV